MAFSIWSARATTAKNSRPKTARRSSIATMSPGSAMAMTGVPSRRPIGTTWCRRATFSLMIESAPGASAVFVRSTNRRSWSSAKRLAVAVAVSVTQRVLVVGPGRHPRCGRGGTGRRPLVSGHGLPPGARPGPWTRDGPCRSSLGLGPSELWDRQARIRPTTRDFAPPRGHYSRLAMDPAAARVLAVMASGLVGLVVGSFLNVVVYRLPRGQSVVRPASRCPSCGTPLGSLENVPVLSWVLLRGRCRHCGEPISARYPAIELLTGVLFLALAVALPSFAPLAPLEALGAVTIAIGAIDLEGGGVPPVLDWIALGCAAPLVPVALLAHTDGRLAWGGIGAAAALLGGVAQALGGPARRDRRVAAAARWAAWGFAAGWMALAGGVAVGGTLAILTLASRSGGRRPLPAGALGAAA